MPGRGTIPSSELAGNIYFARTPLKMGSSKENDDDEMAIVSSPIP